MSKNMNYITVNGPICIEEAASLFLDIIEEKYGQEERDHLKTLGFKRTFNILGAKTTPKPDTPTKYTCDGKKKYTFHYNLSSASNRT
jgi:hypothetical protein